jgi:hypothetical protein
MLESVQIGKIYRNKKNQQLYKVMAIGRHSETLELMVYYVALYLTEDWSDTFRPLELFKEKFEEL